MTLSRPAAKIDIYIANVLRTDLSVVSVSQHLGGGYTDNAIIKVIKRPGDITPVPFYAGYFMQDNSLYAWAVNAPCRIYRKDADGVTRLIHTGRIVSVNADLDSGGEMITLTSRLDNHLFGNLQQYPRRGTKVDGGIGWRCAVMGDIVFNPNVDNFPVPNMFGGLYPEEGVEASLPEYIDPMSFPKKLYGQPIDVFRRWSPSIGYWTITDALFFVMRACSPENGCQFIMPPSSDAIKQMIDPYGMGVERLEELKIDLTDTVPVMLDRILAGTEYTWYIDYDWPELPRITFVSRAFPQRVQALTMQRYGTEVHSVIGRTDVKQYSLQYDIANESANTVGVLYGPLKMEVSIPLYPAWFKEYDTTTVSELIKNDSEGDMTPELARVWRDWVANETGDYTTRIAERMVDPQGGLNLLRTSFESGVTNSRIWTTDATIDKDFMERYPYCRLPFERCLTQGPDGSSVGDATGGVVIQYWIEGETTEWRPIEELFSSSFSASILRTECGIRFSSTEKPLEKLMSMRAKYGEHWARFFWIRATGTINFGNVLYAQKQYYWDRNQSFLYDKKVITVDRTGKHQLSDLNSDSLFYNRVFVTKDMFAATNDDSFDAWKFAERAATVYSCAKCSGSMTLEGVDTTIQPLGLCISGFTPRNVDLTTSPPALSSLTPLGGRYPLVIGVEYNIQAQEVALSLDTYRVNPNKFMKRAL